jgi:hypothetical protein
VAAPAPVLLAPVHLVALGVYRQVQAAIKQAARLVPQVPVVPLPIVSPPPAVAVVAHILPNFFI